MRKQPKISGVFDFSRKLVSGVILAETLLFAGSYYFYYRMNRSREFRLFMRDNFNFGLEAYYKIGEYLDPNLKIREADTAIWRKK